MNEILLQLGVGGIFAILLVREVRFILRDRQPHAAGGGNGNGNVAGSWPPKYWEQQMSEIVRKENIETLAPHRADLIRELHEVRKGIEEMIRLLGILIDRDNRERGNFRGRRAEGG